MKTVKAKMLLTCYLGALSLVACDKTDRSFSLAADGATFQQAPNVITRKIDVLWVVDNSGSMASSQSNLTDRFTSFINRFQSLNYDFHMAVTSTDAWRGNFSSNPDFKNAARRVRRGPLFGSGTNFYYSPDSGVDFMTPSTPNLTNVFITNATQGTLGSGDERAFSSFEDVLSYTGNSDFRRSDAFLAVIILSDEDDFSGNTGSYFAGNYRDETNTDPLVLPFSSVSTDIYNLYLDPALTPVSHYKDYLDTYAGAGNYSVSAIAVLDNDCKTTLNAQTPGRRLGRRYIELADLTNGAKASLCADFGASLEMISNKILELSSVFKLQREPIESSIHVFVNDAEVTASATDGWTYNATTWEITFHGTAVPSQGSTVNVNFDPKNPLN